MKKLYLLLLLLLLLTPAVTHAAEQEPYRYVNIGGVYRRVGEVRSYPLNEIVPGHPLYDLLPDVFERQFGVQGGVEGFAEHVTEWWADEQQRQRNERRQRQQRSNVILMIVSLVAVGGALSVTWWRGRDADDEFDNDNDRHLVYSSSIGETSSDKTHFDFRYASKFGMTGLVLIIIA